MLASVAPFRRNRPVPGCCDSRLALAMVPPLTRVYYAIRAWTERKDAAEYRRTLGRDALTAADVKRLLRR